MITKLDLVTDVCKKLGIHRKPKDKRKNSFTKNELYRMNTIVDVKIKKG